MRYELFYSLHIIKVSKVVKSRVLIEYFVQDAETRVPDISELAEI